MRALENLRRCRPSEPGLLHVRRDHREYEQDDHAEVDEAAGREFFRRGPRRVFAIAVAETFKDRQMNPPSNGLTGIRLKRFSRKPV